jgi:hypothetical protein
MSPLSVVITRWWILHQLADGSFVEHCICIISRPIV